MYDQKIEIKKPENKPASVSHQTNEMTVIEIDNSKVVVPSLESAKKRDKMINELRFETEKLGDDINLLKRFINDLNTKITNLETKLGSRK